MRKPAEKTDYSVDRFIELAEKLAYFAERYRELAKKMQDRKIPTVGVGNDKTLQRSLDYLQSAIAAASYDVDAAVVRMVETSTAGGIARDLPNTETPSVKRAKTEAKKIIDEEGESDKEIKKREGQKRGSKK